ncbi:MAG: threonylcarbamoyl-AMP synthase [Eubacteriaceae bacterium]|jgi:L-threonylcarbamoyladenylate synthase|nr:threonylcarbamoyl-AMP synthase [Eubacteriaceae bacterium]
MKTIVYEPTEENIKKCAEIIRKGGLVAFPTETVYGLGADAFNEDACRRVYEAKGRPSDNPLIVHIARASDIGQLTPRLSEDIVKLIDNFWPGPLTLVVKKKDTISKTVSGGLDTVAIRLPDSEATRALINWAGTPIVGPSANTSGRPSPTKAEHVLHDLDGRIDAIIDEGDCRVGIESTVLDMTGDVPTILRPGIVTRENLEAALGKTVELDPTLTAGKPADEDFKPKAPGMKYKHYAPKADMLIVEGNREDVKNEVERLRVLNEKLGNKVGILLFEEKTFNEAAHEFFADLRDMDEQGVDMILAGALSDAEGVGFAVMNRMLKSAGYNIVRV